MQIDVTPAHSIGNDVRQWWSAVQSSDTRLASPYFSPEFTAAVASVRDDVYVAVIRNELDVAAVLPFQRTWWGAGRPVGGPLSDFQGIIAATDLKLDAGWLARRCGVRFWDFPYAVAWQKTFEPYQTITSESAYVDLSHGFDAYRDKLRAGGSSLISKSDRKYRKLSREIGPVRFEFNTTDEKVMQMLFLWKSKRYEATGKPDLLRAGWIPKLLYQILKQKSDNFGGVLSALYTGDRLIAAHFGMRSRGVLHWWYPAYDPEMAAHSPGVISCLEVVRAAGANGIFRIDLGYGDEEWKLRFMSDSIKVSHVSVDATDAARALRKTWRGVRGFLRKTNLSGPVGRVIRPIRNWLSLS